MQLTADSLTGELFARALRAEDQSFCLTKTLGTVNDTETADENGEAHHAFSSSERLSVEMNASAVRILKEHFPELQIRYPQTVESEKTVQNGEQTQIIRQIRTDAVIQVPEEFVQIHTGASFRQLMKAEWTKQLDSLTEQIVSRLRRYEIKTERMFGGGAETAALSFRVTEETAESDIWTVMLKQCGFYPLQWDGEICGMAMLLAERLKTALTGDCTAPPETSVRRDQKQKICRVTVYYSIKQD